MIAVTYDGETLARYEFNEVERLYTLTLNKFAPVKLFRRFISRELMDGTEYKNLAARELAVAIFTAFATPTLRFVQQAHSGPQWTEYLIQWTTVERVKDRP